MELELPVQVIHRRPRRKPQKMTTAAFATASMTPGIVVIALRVVVRDVHAPPATVIITNNPEEPVLVHSSTPPTSRPSTT